jgi:hypothetical protein
LFLYCLFSKCGLNVHEVISAFILSLRICSSLLSLSRFHSSDLLTNCSGLYFLLLESLEMEADAPTRLVRSLLESWISVLVAFGLSIRLKFLLNPVIFL